MTSINITFFNTLTIFATILSLCTFSRKFLTYKGLQLLLLSGNIFMFFFCIFFWNDYIINFKLDFFSYKLNPTTWTNVIYEISFKIDSLSFLFIFLVTIIGFCTNIYILNYFKFEEREEEFMLLINWFIFSMIFLVSGNNFFTLILGWELIGLTSFLLINFWKFKSTTLSCSFKAFSFNKFSDLFLMLSFCLLWDMYKISTIDTLLLVIDINKLYTNNTLLASAICLLLCSSVKSAQIFGHLWLPDSMEAPVPASSLIHSATLVSAGIYLILKFQSLFIITNTLNIIVILGSITACYGGLVAASQSDVKKILAYSTVSHCGFIFVTIGLNNFILSIIYLYLHGLFKAVTFFCVGSLIKYNSAQDTRLMGSLKNQPINVLTLIFSAINLGGMPFTFGYLYKEIFLYELTLSSVSKLSLGFSLIGLLSSIIYVYKLIYYSSFDFRKGAFQKDILVLQNYKELLNKYLLSFTYVHVFSTFIIFIMAIFFYLIVKFFILKFYIIFNYSGIFVSNELIFMTKFFYIKKNLISIFYSLFLLLIVVMFLNNTRYNYFYLQTYKIFTLILNFFLFLPIVNLGISYLYLINI